MGKTSAQTIEPSIFPIDWTHNPICQKEERGDSNTISEGNVADVDEMAVKVQNSLNVTDQESAPTSAPKVFRTKFIDGKSMETGRSSFDRLVADAPYDYVVLTDCVFAKELAVPLVNTILCCCGPRTTVICCHEIRDEVRFFAKTILKLPFGCVLMIRCSFTACRMPTLPLSKH